MPSYYTHDYLPDLTASEKNGASTLIFTRNTNPAYSWENEVFYTTTANYALLDDTFVFQGIKGATYDVVSSSFFDPYILLAYDSEGNVIATDDGKMDYGYDHASFVAPYTGLYYVSASWNQGTASSNKLSIVGVYEELSSIPSEPEKNIITGTKDRDFLNGTHMSDIVDGGEGVDTFVLGRQRELYTVSKSGGTITVTDVEGLSGSDVLTNVERIHFFGGNYISWETSGIPAEAYRLYQAAFDRTPDKGGLGYWIGQMGQGTSLQSVAESFTNSVEFKKLYGEAASLGEILNRVYENVLDRAPDKGGYDYWLGLLNNKNITVTDMLIAFSESPENQAQVVGSLQAGYEFTVT
jgi:serralysin